MFLFFDVGGTKIRVACANQSGFVGEPVIIPTPIDFDSGLEHIVATARTRCRGKKITQIVGGLAGTLNRDHSILLHGSHIISWAGRPIKKLLEDALQAPVTLENDAALAGLGEAAVGAGKDYEIVGYITVSTGLGGARITNKIIDRHVFGFEPGHQIVDADGSLCDHCTKHYLEAHVSGRGVEEHYNKKPEEITDPAIWEDVTRTLALGVINTIVFWSPDILVLGGSVMQKISIERIRDFVKENLRIFPELPLIIRAQLGEIGGLEGALQIARTLP